MLQAKLNHLGLSPRETEVLGLVVGSKTNSEIGTILGISPRTVQKHLERIYVRLGVEKRAAAAIVRNALLFNDLRPWDFSSPCSVPCRAI